MTIRLPLAAAFCWPVTWIVSVWLALVRPIASYIGTRISSLFENVSTFLWNTPSTETAAMPVPGERPPIQVTDGPVKVNEAWAPAAVEIAAVPPLQVLLVSPCVHPDV